jgi:hypothetical protein
MTDVTRRWFAGVDWGSERHQVCLLDEVGTVGSGKNLGRYAASWIACWPKRPSSTAALT